MSSEEHERFGNDVRVPVIDLYVAHAMQALLARGESNFVRKAWGAAFDLMKERKNWLGVG